MHGHQVVHFSFADPGNEPSARSDYFPDHPQGVRALSGYFYNREVEKALEALLEADKPDIANVHLMWGGMTPAIFRPLKKAGVPLVHTVHDYRMVCPAYTFRNGAGEICEKCRRGRWLPCICNRCSKGSLARSAMMAAEMYTRGWFHDPLKNIDGFIFVSNFCRQKHIDHNPGFASSRNIVLYNTASLRCDSPSSRGDYFLYYGRLSHEKGIEDLIEAFSADGMPNLIVAGTGPLEEELKSRAAGAGNIEFAGFRSGESLWELVRGCSYVVVPSRWYENNPMTIVEAYSLGKPVIGAAIGGIPEILEGKGSGFIYPPGDVAALEACVRQASDVDDRAYEAISCSALSFHRDNFAETPHYEKLIAFFDRVISEYRSRRR